MTLYVMIGITAPLPTPRHQAPGFSVPPILMHRSHFPGRLIVHKRTIPPGHDILQHGTVHSEVVGHHDTYLLLHLHDGAGTAADDGGRAISAKAKQLKRDHGIFAEPDYLVTGHHLEDATTPEEVLLPRQQQQQQERAATRGLRVAGPPPPPRPSPPPPSPPPIPALYPDWAEYNG